MFSGKLPSVEGEKLTASPAAAQIRPISRKRRPVYLASDVLRWRASLSYTTYLPEAYKHRAYDLLRRAEFFLSSPHVSDADLADCLGNLRRAMTHRVESLEKTYRLRVPLQSGKKPHFLKLLAEVGIVRPLLLQALLEARNAVEYRDRKPPSKRRCEELAESVWYFLRSTDRLVVHRRVCFCLNPLEDGYPSDTYFLEFDVRYGSRFRMNVRGVIPTNMASLTPISGGLRVDAHDFGSMLKQSPNNSNQSDKEDRWRLMGYLAPEVQSVRALLRLAFEAE